jgi:hypothetical protein
MYYQPFNWFLAVMVMALLFFLYKRR